MSSDLVPDSPRDEYYAIRSETAAALRDFVEAMKKSGVGSADARLLAEIRRLETELRHLKKSKRYGLVWENKPEEFEAEAKNALPVLEEVGELAFSDGSDRPQNLIIEGDNFHSLAALSYTHKGLVDVIYIDPPYNTGNKDFVYNDRFVDKEDDFRHSKWLSFMEKRLRLARDLLKETGVIFISIDDNEQAQLKMLCDEVFGEGNFVGQVVWQKKYGPANDAKWISGTHEYVITFSKTEKWQPWLIGRNDEQLSAYKNPDADSRGPWRASDLSARTPAKSCIYEIVTPSWRRVMPPASRSWAISRERYEELLSDGRISFWTTWNGRPMEKRFLSEVKDGITPQTWWPRDFADDNKIARYEMKEIFPENPFDTPKPVKLISRILALGWTKDSLILDFFAGSGTTGHAVLQLNKEDGGNRRFILCSNRENTAENPDKNLCRDVCYQRVKRVAQGYENAKGENVPGLGGNLRYFKTAFVPKDRSLDDLRHRFVDRSTDLLRIRESCFDPLPDFAADDGLRAFSGVGKTLAVLYDPLRLDDFAALLGRVRGPVSAYVFTLAPESFSEELAHFAPRVTLEPVPDAILSAYRTIFGL